MSLITQDETKCKLNGKSISLYGGHHHCSRRSRQSRASVSEDGSSVENTIPNANFEIMGNTSSYIYRTTKVRHIPFLYRALATECLPYAIRI